MHFVIFREKTAFLAAYNAKPEKKGSGGSIDWAIKRAETPKYSRHALFKRAAGNPAEEAVWERFKNLKDPPCAITALFDIIRKSSHKEGLRYGQVNPVAS